TTPNSATPIDPGPLTQLWGEFRAARRALRQARTASAAFVAALRAKGTEIGEFLTKHPGQLANLRALGIPRSTAYRLMQAPAALELRGNKVTLALSDAQAQALRAALSRLDDPALPSFNLAEDWLRVLIRRCQAHLQCLLAFPFSGIVDRFAPCLPSASELRALHPFRIPALAA